MKTSLLITLLVVGSLLGIGAATLVLSCDKADDIETFDFGATIADPSALTTRVVSAPPTVYLKFDTLKAGNGTYISSVYARSNKQDTEIFGINLRFFYDQTDFTSTLRVKNFAGGYGLTSLGQPKVNNMAPSSKVILATDGPLRFVNGAVQLNNKDTTAILLDTVQWKRLFDLEFTPIQPTTDVRCAPLVWDKMKDPKQGGISPSAGLIITVLVDPSTGYETGPTIATGPNYNWLFKDLVVRGVYPYGNILCAPVAPLN